MAQRPTDDGRDVPARTSPPNGTPLSERERERRAAEAPPGSRERSESDATGWSPERDEDPSARQGRYHRAARLRLSQPRTEVGAPPPEHDTSHQEGQRGRRWPWSRSRPAVPPPGDASAPYGPYGRDDRAAYSSSGQGMGPLLGDQETYHSLDRPHTPRDYRPWDRTGPGADTPPLGRGPYTEPGGRETFHTDGEEQRVHEERVHHGGRNERDFAPRHPEDRPRHEGRGERDLGPRHTEERRDPGEYSELVGMGQRPPAREARPESETGRRGRWKREPLTARELMTRNVKTARLESSLRDVARIMKDEDCGIVPVVDERGRLRGLITDRDLVIRTLAEGRPPDTLLARDIMTDDVEAVTPDEDIHGIIALMGQRQVRRVPVVERDDRLVGIIAMADIATRADSDEELQNALDRISARRSFWSRLY
ncbi:MAG TPA: CBS domain-containing protein [Archangium sp.]|jgi:CBS domain-containing protein|uniref:CBS domain-containing protein n=1 Tax=Archangium sp. TaxID=1872627 RepID=UPI002EDA9E10